MEMMDINSQELKKIVALYSNFIEIKENMERNVNQVIPEEYFLINLISNGSKNLKRYFIMKV